MKKLSGKLTKIIRKEYEVSERFIGKNEILVLTGNDYFAPKVGYIIDAHIAEFLKEYKLVSVDRPDPNSPSYRVFMEKRDVLIKIK